MSDYLLGPKVCKEPKGDTRVIKRLGPKLWSVDGKFQDFDPCPPPPVIPNWEGLTHIETD